MFTHGAQSEIKSLRSEIGDLRNQLNNTIKTGRREYRGLKQDIGSKIVGSKTYHVVSLVNKPLGKAGRYVLRGSGQLGGQMSNKPLVVLTLAFGVGMLAGRMLMKR